MRTSIAFLFFLSFSVLAFSQTEDTIVIHFAFNSSIPEKNAGVILHQYLEKNISGFQLSLKRISAHCDSTGSNEYNQLLSQSRLLAAYRLALQAGFDTANIVEQHAYGKTMPLNDNATESERALNRRAEFVFLRIPLAVSASVPKKQQSRQSELETQIMDSATQIGDRFILKNLNFIGDRHLLVQSSEQVLFDLLEALKKNPGLEIDIHGYVCCTPENRDAYDVDTRSPDLSVQRAKSVYEFLLQHGIDPSRLQYHGFGGANKLYPFELNEREQELNRRVEIKILKKQERKNIPE